LLHDFYRAPASCRHPQQRDRRRCKTAVDFVDRVDQLGQLDCAVMRRDIAIRVGLLQEASLTVSSSHDPLFRFHRWLANLCVLEIDEIKSVPYVPVSHPFIERLIGTVRREYLDRVFFWNSVDLTRKLGAFRDYYNASRVHRSLDGTTPARCAGALSSAPISLDHYSWRQHCGGLFQTFVAA